MYYSKSMDTQIERGIILSLNQCPKTDKERDRQSNVPYASAI